MLHFLLVKESELKMQYVYSPHTLSHVVLGNQCWTQGNFSWGPAC